MTKMYIFTVPLKVLLYKRTLTPFILILYVTIINFCPCLLFGFREVTLLKQKLHPGEKCDCAQHENPTLFQFFRMCRIFWHLAQCGRMFCTKRNVGIFFDFFSIFL